MAEVASAYVSLIPSARGFGSEIERTIGGDVVAASRSQGRRAGSVFARSYLGPLKLIGATAVGFFAVDKLKDMLSFGIDVASQNEQAQISFTTMLGSAKKARAFIGQLQQFAAKTPFDFPGLQKSASSLISIGVNAKDVIPIMTTLGNVTSGMGTGAEGIQRATVAIQQMIAAQAIHAEDLNQLRDAGIPVYDLLSAALGKSKKQVSALVQAGKLGKPALDALLGALKSGKGLERFNGLMDKQSRSLAGLASTFKDTFGQGLAAAIKPLLPLLKDGLGKASAVLADVLPKVQSAFKGLVDSIRSGTGPGGKLSGIIDGLQGAFSKVRSFITGSLLPSLANLWAALQPALTQALAAAWQAVGNLLGLLKPLGSVLTGVTGFLKEHKTIVQAVAVAVLAGVVAFKAWTTAIKVWQAVTKAAIAVAAAWDAVLDANPVMLVVIAIAALAAGLIYAYKNSETFRKVVDTAFHAIGAAGKWLWNNILQPVIKFIVEGFALVADKIGDFLDALSHIPGFGWAKTAADAMHTAADKAQELADNINKIHDKHVTVTYSQVNENSVQAHNRNRLDGERAGGGPVDAGGAYLVGERGPELFVPGHSGSIIPHGALGRAAGGSMFPPRVQLVVSDRQAFDLYVREQAGSQYVAERNFDHVSGGR